VTAPYLCHYPARSQPRTALGRRGMLSAALMGGAAVAGLAVGQAKADTAFTSFAFLDSASGATTTRTDPARWADVTNVLSFGADPTGVSPSDTAVQNAVYHAGGGSGSGSIQAGIIFFPPGNYTFNASVSLGIDGLKAFQIILDGGNAATITGNFADYIFKHAVVSGGSG